MIHCVWMVVCILFIIPFLALDMISHSTSTQSSTPDWTSSIDSPEAYVWFSLPTLDAKPLNVSV